MRKTIISLIATLMIPSVLADNGSECGYGMMGSGMGFYGILWWILVAFVFAIIFWSTYKWIIGNKKKTKR